MNCYYLLTASIEQVPNKRFLVSENLLFNLPDYLYKATRDQDLHFHPAPLKESFINKFNPDLEEIKELDQVSGIAKKENFDSNLGYNYLTLEIEDHKNKIRNKEQLNKLVDQFLNIPDLQFLKKLIYIKYYTGGGINLIFKFAPFKQLDFISDKRKKGTVYDILKSQVKNADFENIVDLNGFKNFPAQSNRHIKTTNFKYSCNTEVLKINNKVRPIKSLDLTLIYARKNKQILKSMQKVSNFTALMPYQKLRSLFQELPENIQESFICVAPDHQETKGSRSFIIPLKNSDNLTSFCFGCKDETLASLNFVETLAGLKNTMITKSFIDWIKAKVGLSSDLATSTNIDAEDFRKVSLLNSLRDYVLNKNKDTLFLFNKLIYLYNEKSGLWENLEIDEFIYTEVKKNISQQVLSLFSTSTQEFREIKAGLLEIIPRKKKFPDQNYEILTFNNGVYDLKENIFRNYDPEDFCLSKYEVDYLENAKDDQFQRIEKYLKTLVKPADLQKLKGLIAYSIMNIPSKIYFLLGSASNGKTLFQTLLESALSEDKVSKLTLNQIVEQPFYRKELIGKTLNSTSELPRKFNINSSPESQLKLFFGELGFPAKVSTPVKFKNPIEFYVNATFVASGNEIPVLRYDQAMIRRLEVIEFVNKFKPSVKFSRNLLTNKNKTLLLNYIVSDCINIYNNEIDQYFSTQDELYNIIDIYQDIVKFILHIDYYRVDQETSVKYEAFKNKVLSERRSRQIKNLITDNELISNLSNLGFPTIIKNGERFIENLKVKDYFENIKSDNINIETNKKQEKNQIINEKNDNDWSF